MSATWAPPMATSLTSVKWMIDTTCLRQILRTVSAWLASRP